MPERSKNSSRESIHNIEDHDKEPEDHSDHAGTGASSAEEFVLLLKVLLCHEGQARQASVKVDLYGPDAALRAVLAGYGGESVQEGAGEDENANQRYSITVSSADTSVPSKKSGILELNRRISHAQSHGSLSIDPCLLSGFLALY